jgi:hypothetical protein
MKRIFIDFLLYLDSIEFDQILETKKEYKRI